MWFAAIVMRAGTAADIVDFHLRAIITSSWPLIVFKRSMYLASCLMDTKFHRLNESEHEVRFTDTEEEMIFTVLLPDVATRIDLNSIESRVKKSISLSMQEAATELKDSNLWIHPFRKFIVE